MWWDEEMWWIGCPGVDALWAGVDLGIRLGLVVVVERGVLVHESRIEGRVVRGVISPSDLRFYTQRTVERKKN
jgi:hypothetical protein